MKTAFLSRRELFLASLGALAGCSAPQQHSNRHSADLSPVQGSIRLRDVAQQAGLHYLWKVQGTRPLNILGTIGCGCAFLDFTGNGFLDILLIGPKPALFAGDGTGAFTDITREVGMDKLHGYFLGCAVGDFDNDGYPDIYLTAYEGGVLLKNEKGRMVHNVTRDAGIPAQPWGTSAAWVQLDPHRPLLDLLVCNYVSFNGHTHPQLCPVSGKMSACGPRFYTPHHARLYRNSGSGKFTDVSRQWGMQHTHGKALGVACADYNQSGRQSIALANDEVEGDLLQNLGGHFNNVAALAGTGFDHDGNPHGGMGTDWGDYDNDGLLDLLVATFQHENKCVYHNDGGGIFSEVSAQLGLSNVALPYVSFGAKWLDIDNDGWLDIVLANGHVQDNIHQIDQSSTYREPSLLLHNRQGKQFVDISASCGPALSQRIVGRGLAIGDYDNDGKMDILIVNSEGAPLLLHNESVSVGHWLQLKLQGKHCNRDGLGASVLFEAEGRKMLRMCHTDGSYMSASDPRVHCGLGSAVSAKATVTWPDGSVQELGELQADRVVQVTQA